MKKKNRSVCSVGRAWSLDNIFRRWFHDPERILKHHVKAGMTVLDIGCGPGLFAIGMAEMVGRKGRVIAADMQQGMLDILKQKIKGKDIRKRIRLHRCKKDKIGISGKVDFVLAFYMVHEVPDKDRFFREIKAMLRPGGKILIIEPMFHVSKQEFEQNLKKSFAVGFRPIKRQWVFFSRAVVLRR